ncbi:MAG: hypothetical protein ACRECQ_18540 [Burkholderiaceae bacterium]
MISESLKLWLVGLIMAACAAYFAYDRYSHRTVANRGPVTEVPQQSSTRAETIQRAGYTIEPVAEYSVRARVLSIERYRIGREADLSPLDFALGWGAMSDQAVIEKLAFSQSNRWYQYRWSDAPPIDPSIIASTSANTHLVPASETIKDRLFDVRKGAVVRLSGYLINVKHSDGWSWRSSLSRTDTGGGACELMWVTDVEVEQ